MRLSFKIENKLYYISNFLDHNTYKKIHSDACRSKPELYPAKETWDADLLKGFPKDPYRTYLAESYPPVSKMKLLLCNNPFYRIPMDKQFTFHFHSMGDQSGINWHGDKGYEYGITYYINHRWNPYWGGEFMYEDDHFGYFPVQGNSLIILKAPVKHKVSPVLKPNIPRMTIQAFI